MADSGLPGIGSSSLQISIARTAKLPNQLDLSRVRFAPRVIDSGLPEATILAAPKPSSRNQLPLIDSTSNVLYFDPSSFKTLEEAPMMYDDATGEEFEYGTITVARLVGSGRLVASLPTQAQPQRQDGGREAWDDRVQERHNDENGRFAAAPRELRVPVGPGKENMMMQKKSTVRQQHPESGGEDDFDMNLKPTQRRNAQGPSGDVAPKGDSSRHPGDVTIGKGSSIASFPSSIMNAQGSSASTNAGITIAATKGTLKTGGVGGKQMVKCRPALADITPQVTRSNHFESSVSAGGKGESKKAMGRAGPTLGVHDGDKQKVIGGKDMRVGPPMKGNGSRGSLARITMDKYRCSAVTTQYLISQVNEPRLPLSKRELASLTPSVADTISLVEDVLESFIQQIILSRATEIQGIEMRVKGYLYPTLRSLKASGVSSAIPLNPYLTDVKTESVAAFLDALVEIANVVDGVAAGMRKAYDEGVEFVFPSATHEVLQIQLEYVCSRMAGAVRGAEFEDRRMGRKGVRKLSMSGPSERPAKKQRGPVEGSA